MSPEQYDANVKTKKSRTEFVEFAIKLPGKDDVNSTVYLPIDAKFPKDIYEQYYDAFEAGDTALIESSGKQLENTIKKMAKDIHDKYVDPPFTTDFAIMFYRSKVSMQKLSGGQALSKHFRRNTKSS